MSKKEYHDIDTITDWIEAEKINYIYNKYKNEFEYPQECNNIDNKYER